MCLGRPTLPFLRRVTHREEQDADSAKQHEDSQSLGVLVPDGLVHPERKLPAQSRATACSVTIQSTSNVSGRHGSQMESLGPWPSCTPHQNPFSSQPQGEPAAGQVWAPLRSSKTRYQSKGTGEDQGESNGNSTS